MSYQNLLYSVDDRVATITLNRPERHNALSAALVDEIMAAMTQADRDPEVRIVILAGAGGKAFSSGYDIKESAEKPKRTVADWRVRMQKDIQFTYSVWDCSKPVIAMIDGFCLAGALELAMCCDMRYCSDVSTFAALEARFSNGIATLIMPWLIGRRSRALIYSGDTITADEAFRLGLVDKTFPKSSPAGGGDQDRKADVARLAGMPADEQEGAQQQLRDHGAAARRSPTAPKSAR